MTRKTIVSVTLDDSQIARLTKYANEKHDGNKSQAVRAMIMATVNLSLEDFEHPYPPKARNWMGTGKCNPKNASVGACPLCWGENAQVDLVRDHRGIQRVVVTQRGEEE